MTDKEIVSRVRELIGCKIAVGGRRLYVGNVFDIPYAGNEGRPYIGRRLKLIVSYGSVGIYDIGKARGDEYVELDRLPEHA